MTREEIVSIVSKQRAFFNTGKTLDVNFRIEMLKKLKSAIASREEKI